MKLTLRSSLLWKILKTAAGSLAGYLVFCLLSYAYEFYRMIVYKLRGFDAESAVLRSIKPPLGLLTLITGDWREFFQYANHTYAVCYILMVLGAWFFLWWGRKVRDLTD